MYENKDGKCECWQCELKETCQYADKYQRLPRELVLGALGLCKKLKKTSCSAKQTCRKQNNSSKL